MLLGGIIGVLSFIGAILAFVLAGAMMGQHPLVGILTILFWLVVMWLIVRAIKRRRPKPARWTVQSHGHLVFPPGTRLAQHEDAPHFTEPITPGGHNRGHRGRNDA